MRGEERRTQTVWSLAGQNETFSERESWQDTNEEKSKKNERD